jgi:hypothetical protein
MYTEESVSISKADDGGYVIHVKVKMKKEKGDKNDVCCGPSREDKMLIAKDLDEVKEVLDKVLPKLKKGGMDEDEFDDAFKEAAKEAK